METFIKHKFIAGLLLLSCIAVVIYGCDGDSFLTAPTQGTLDEAVLANPDGVEANLIGTYRALGSMFGDAATASVMNWVFGSITTDDAYKGSEPGDGDNFTQLEQYLWTTSGADGDLNGRWGQRYEGISRANSTISLLNDLLEEDPEIMPEDVVNSIRGEALFLRAHFHFDLWQMWGNIPFMTEEDEDFRKANDVDVIPLILQDLENAIELLPLDPRNGEVGRATQWTAKAYLGRVQMHINDYQSALNTLRDVSDNGPYELEENYHHVWTAIANFANGSETILAYQASANDGSGDGENANFGERLAFPHSGSPFGCCGFHQPSKNLVNFFKVDDNGLPLSLTDDSWNDFDGNFTSAETAAVDPRLDWTVGRDGVPYLDWGNHASDWIRDRSFSGPYSPKKNVHEDGSDAQSNVGWVPTQLNSNNIHIYRYADLLLMLAEAEVEVGSLENARAIVNKIRERAGVAAQGPGNDLSDVAVPIDDPSITWANYQIGTYDEPWTDQNMARELVRTERRLELAMEGQRKFDLRRWGTFVEVLNDYLQVEQQRRAYLGAAATVEERHRWYPIPSTQIDLHEVEGESRLQQNPGW